MIARRQRCAEMKRRFNFGRLAARGAVRMYQFTFSSIVGSQCRHLPTCSSYVDEAIARHGVWAGGFMGLARVCRCQPCGTAGFDPVPEDLPANAHWLRPWSYGRWRGPLSHSADAAEDEPISSRPPLSID
jgi:putative membrane protein insertion efficiency factor